MADSKEEKFILTSNLSSLDYDKFKEILIEAIDRLNNLQNVSNVFDDQNSFNAACFICMSMSNFKDFYKCYDSKNCADRGCCTS